MKSYHFSLFLLIIVACAEQPENDSESNNLADSERDYTLIRDDLYKDDSGNLYHRTIDVSAADNPDDPERGKQYSYRDYARLDTIINGEETFVCIHLKDLVDPTSFHRVLLEDSDVDHEIYEDKHMRYFLKFVADGGTLEATRKKFTSNNYSFKYTGAFF